MKTVIIILGAARSGSTLLAKAIGGHSACFGLGEINRFNEEIENPDTHCGCGEKLNLCSFWSQILQELNLDFTSTTRQSDNFNVGIFNQLTKKKYLHKLINTVVFKSVYTNKLVEREIENTFTLYNKIFEKTNVDVLVDSTKGLLRAIVLASRSDKNINFKFIQLTRDGRGVLNSNLKTSYSIKHKDGSIVNYKGHDKTKNPSKLIRAWLYINLRNFVLLKLFYKKKTLFVNYEQFTGEPESNLRKIYDFLQLEYEPEVLDLSKHEQHILGGNASRINAKKITKQDDKWQTDLDAAILRSFNRKAGWFNRLAGYK